ncbi:hypothetical protein, partial [Flavonifractor plautii]|uniref:hypothetical protein n=1 Tax=Flavonifractor plautii TaxID=292800 RepID=UPI002330D51B
ASPSQMGRRLRRASVLPEAKPCRGRDSLPPARDEIRGAPAGLGRLGHSGSDEADDKLLLS